MSDLTKTALALQNQYLQQRVHAAVVQVAHQQRDTEGSVGLFARMVLAELTRHYDDFILDVATNPSVIDVLVLADDHNSVTSTQISDNDIIYIVNGTFPVAAEKYTPAPDDSGGE